MERITLAQYRDLVAGKFQLPPRRAPARSIPPPAIKVPVDPLTRILGPISVGSLVLQPEEQIAAAFGATLRAGALDGRLSAVFCHVPNEIAGRRQSRTAQIRYTIAKAMGLIEGAPDYLFLWQGGSGALEAKTRTGRQTDGQHGFEAWCERESVPYRIFRSAEEGLEILEGWGVWSDHIP